MTSRSIVGRTDSPDFDMLDAMIASALKTLLDKHIHFRRRVMVEEQRAQTCDRFLRGRQVAHVIYVRFRATRAYEAVQGLPDLFSFRLQSDDAQDFDVRWDQPLLSASEVPSDVILKGLYKSKLQDTVQLQTLLALYTQETVRKQWTDNLFTIEDVCKTSNWSDDENSKLQGLQRSCGKRISYQESKRKETLRWEESGRVFSVEGTWTMFQSKGDSCSFGRDTIASGNSDKRSETKRTIVFSCTKFECKDRG